MQIRIIELDPVICGEQSIILENLQIDKRREKIEEGIFLYEELCEYGDCKETIFCFLSFFFQ